MDQVDSTGEVPPDSAQVFRTCVRILFVFGLWLAALPAHSDALVHLPYTAHSEKYDNAEASCFTLGMS